MTDLHDQALSQYIRGQNTPRGKRASFSGELGKRVFLVLPENLSASIAKRNGNILPSSVICSVALWQPDFSHLYIPEAQAATGQEGNAYSF